MGVSIDIECDELYGLILEPYAWILISTAIFMVLQFIFEDVVQPSCVQPFLHHLVDTRGYTCLECLVYRSGTFRDTMCEVPKPKDVELGRGAGGGTSTADVVVSPVQQQQRRDMTPAPASSASGDGDVASKMQMRRVENKKMYPMLFFYVQMIASIITFVFICISFDRGNSGWEAYTNFYGALGNSCILTTLVTAGKKLMILDLEDAKSEEFEPKSTKTASQMLTYLSLPLIAIFMPCFYTHVIPGLVVFCWFFLAAGVGFFCIMLPLYILSASCLILTASCAVEKWLRRMGTELYIRFVFTLFFQTLFNYMALFYSLPLGHITPQKYMNVIVQEYWLRSQTTCFLEHKFGSVRQAIPFFSWL